MRVWASFTRAAAVTSSTGAALEASVMGLSDAKTGD
jgi:hypothetical protein